MLYTNVLKGAVAMFLQRVLLEIEKKGTTKSKMLKDLGLNHNAFAKWKDPTCTPNGATLSKIASYFNVTVDYLLGRTDMPVQELIIPESLRDVPVAFHRGEFEDLTQAEVDALAAIAEGYKAKRALERQKQKANLLIQ